MSGGIRISAQGFAGEAWRADGLEDLASHLQVTFNAILSMWETLGLTPAEAETRFQTAVDEVVAKMGALVEEEFRRVMATVNENRDLLGRVSALQVELGESNRAGIMSSDNILQVKSRLLAELDRLNAIRAARGTAVPAGSQIPPSNPASLVETGGGQASAASSALPGARMDDVPALNAEVDDVGEHGGTNTTPCNQM